MKKLLTLGILLFSSWGMAADNLHELTLKQAQKELDNGSLTSQQLVKYYLKRIKQYDSSGPKLNAVVQLNPHALEQARQLDNQRQQHQSHGPLYGIPVLLKDNIDTADGMANTAGSLALKDNYPQQDAFLVKRLRQAGAIILGKTNLSEWANFRSTRSSSGWSGLYGQTHNPYDVTRSPCGSSSGSGVAVAADLTLLAIGTETDGSVTCPSSVNGIVGIKPSLGLVSRSGIIPISHSQDTAGPMARTVTDAVMLLSVMAGVDEHDPQRVKGPGDYLSHLKRDGLKGKRIGIVRELMGYHDGVDALFEKAVAVLKQQGAIIVDNVEIPNMDKWGDVEYQVLISEFKTDLNHYLANTPAGVPKSLQALITFNQQHAQQEMPYFGQETFIAAQKQGPLTDKTYLDALHNAKRWSGPEGIDAALKANNLDLLIAPTNQPAWKIDWVNGDHYTGSATSPAAISGYPHITVPMGFVQGLPVGLSFFTRMLGEDTLIEAAYGYEQASHMRKPPTL